MYCTYIAKYIHGSADSTDTDVYYVVSELPSRAEAKTICDSIDNESDNENANLITIENGIVTNCYKGTIDEVNNSLFITYNLHKQQYPLLITHLVDRDKELKYIRAVRIILSHLSRSEYRMVIKHSLTSCNFNERIDVLKTICNAFKKDTIDIEKCVKASMSKKDILKVIAFQIGQCLGLMQGFELYTKRDIADCYELLKPYLYREEADLKNLGIMLQKFIDGLNQCIIIVNGGIATINGNIYDIKNEKGF